MNDSKNASKKAVLVVARGGCDAGMTLLEVMFALGILVAAIIWSLLGITGAAAANRKLSMNITANAAIRMQTEEVSAVALDNASTLSNAAHAIIKYYGGGDFAALGSTADSDSLPIGPNSTRVPKVELDAAQSMLICRFMVPEPGQQSRYQVNNGVAVLGDMKPDQKAIGQMIIYMDETTVLPVSGDGIMWADLGDKVNSRTSGFDLNRDGKIEARSGAITAADLRNPRNLDILQLPIDISVTYFGDTAHKHEVATFTNRLVITGDSLGK